MTITTDRAARDETSQGSAAGPSPGSAPLDSLYREGQATAPPPALAAALGAAGMETLDRTLRQARDQGVGVTLVVTGTPVGDDGNRLRAKRRHDVKAALRTFGFTVKALESGYRFDDDKARAKLDAIAKALVVLEREGELLASVLCPD